MKNQFVTYEIALKLKELGFNEKCFGYYKPMKEWMMEGTKFNSERHFHGCNWANLDNTMYFMYIQNSFGDREASIKNSEFTKAIKNIAVPLWQQVIDWFREKYDLHISFEPVYKPKQFQNLMYCYAISTKKNFYGGMDDNLDAWLTLNDGGTMFHIENSYYSAREQAILKAIELCQKK